MCNKIIESHARIGAIDGKAVRQGTNSGVASYAHAQTAVVLFTCTLRYSRYRMSLASCSRFFRPCLSRIRPALSSTRSRGCRLFSSLEKRPNFAVNRLQSARQASGGQGSSPLNENGLLVLGIGLLGGSLFYVSMTLIIYLTRFLYYKW